MLTKAYLELESLEPQAVAQAFYEVMKAFDLDSANQVIEDNVTLPSLHDEESTMENATSKGDDDEKSATSDNESKSKNVYKLLTEFVHVLQFFHLCFKKKITPISYSVDVMPAIKSWFNALCFSNLQPSVARSKCQSQKMDLDSDSDDDISSPDQKIFERKNHIFISTMLKINDAMDKNYKDKSKKEPSFSRLEEHRKNLILNASAISPYDTPATQPTEFFSAFLVK